MHNLISEIYNEKIYDLSAASSGKPHMGLQVANAYEENQNTLFVFNISVISFQIGMCMYVLVSLCVCMYVNGWMDGCAWV